MVPTIPFTSCKNIFQISRYPAHTLYNHVYGYRYILLFIFSDTYGMMMAALRSRNVWLLMDLL